MSDNVTKAGNPRGAARTEWIQKIAIDYVVHEMTAPQICEKYNISSPLFYKIALENNFAKRRKQYKEKMVDKAMKSLSTRQNSILTKATLILQRQVERLELWQRNNPGQLIDNKRMQELIGMYSLLTKEYRLDNNKATENQNITINVSMPDIPIITENGKNDIEAEAVSIDEEDKSTEAIEEIKIEHKEESLEINNDEDLLSPLEEEDD